MVSDSIVLDRDRRMALDKLITVHTCLGFIFLGFNTHTIKDFALHVIC